MEAIRRRFGQKYQSDPDSLKNIIDIGQWYFDSGLSERFTLERLNSKDEYLFWQQFSEIIIAHKLASRGVELVHPREGPDFCFDHNECRVWVEVIAPEPKGIPEDWLNHKYGIFSFPHQEILLRWTSSIKEKHSKFEKYKINNIVGESDICIICINGINLRGLDGISPQINGISQTPFAVEALLSVGPMQVSFKLSKESAQDLGHQHRNAISKPSGADVPTDTFWDKNYEGTSAVWAVDLDETALNGNYQPMAIVHNPLAKNPLGLGVIPAHEEYRAKDLGDFFEIKKENGTESKSV
ncbi:hypothetical protein [Oceanibaculum sp.]|uniref:hypothetical protein n=1 Tax=Oceanibaculum sp. TaxID=1903597 RepID=UPI002587D57C|nr:hypothetical protein [Oceanibaculum sp.]MCH2395038.1 hypothetical protein [Oceanibaculum sp.]